MIKQRIDKEEITPGRKYRLALISLLILLAGFGVSAVNPVLASLYPQLITGVISVLFVYCGGNVANKIVLKKTDLNSNQSAE